MEDIINVKNEAIAQISAAFDTAELEELRVAYLGRNGKFNSLLLKLKDLPPDSKKHFGITLNESKSTVEKLLETQKSKIKNSVREWFDPTVPGIKKEVGHLHLITQAIEDISQVFKQIGFVRARYPEVEWDFFSFGALNFDEWHPARDEWETFLIDAKPHKKYGPMLLTPHTSSGQIREMQRVKTPPIRMVNIAKCYRRQSDASHYPMFHQFEGLVVDREISIVNLKGTLDYFAKSYFGADRMTRIRPYNFPFTEPSFEVDINCAVCKGSGVLKDGSKCKLCKSGWLEIGGAGMVHPNVLKNGGIDPKVYSGFAFGWGVERVLMMRTGLNIPDLRLLYSSDIRFLKQF
jgi:phenylalanyl-tRNA synthetase alpha chain